MNEIITQINKIEKEQIRRGYSKLSQYNRGKKVHKKQMLFHKCKKGNRWVFGGNRSGKTECGAVETVWLARGIHPYRKNRDNVSCWVVSLSQQVQREVAQAKILSYLEKSWISEVVMLNGRKGSLEYGVIDYIMIKNVFGGLSKIAFKSCESGREKFQGVSLDFVWFDEEPPHDIYLECKMRLIDKEGFLFGTMTPLKGLTWVHDTIYLNNNNDSEVWCEFINWYDNPYLSKKELKHLSNTMSADELDSRCYGRFACKNGLVYREFDENIHVIDPFDVPKEWYDNISIDPGLNNPLSAHWYAVDGDGVVYVIAEHYLAQRDITYHAKRIKEICNQLDWQKDRYGKICALIDSAANQKTLASSCSVTELFIEQGINVNPKVNKDLFSGINRVKSYLGNGNSKPKIYIFRNCVNMIREFKNYYFGDGERPNKSDDHSLDELRYYISSRPEAYVPLPNPPSLIALDKEKLIRKKLANKHYLS